MIQVYILNISPLYNPDIFHHFYQISLNNRKNKADLCKHQTDKARCIGAGILLSHAYELYQKKELAKANSFDAFIYKNYTDLSEKLSTSETGKPYLKGQGFTEPYINLSHSGDFAACAIGTSNVGIDVQKLVKIRGVVVKRCFTSDEQQRIKNASTNDHSVESDRIFTQIWSQKEAVSKLNGRGIAYVWENTKTQSAKADPYVQTESIWIDEEYVLSLAYEDIKVNQESDRKSDKESQKLSAPVILDSDEVFRC